MDKTAEEIVAEYRGINEYQIAGRHKMLVDAIKEYHQSRLSELKERVKELRIKTEGGLAPGMKTTNYVRRDQVLNLIEEML